MTDNAGNFRRGTFVSSHVGGILRGEDEDGLELDLVPGGPRRSALLGKASAQTSRGEGI